MPQIAEAIKRHLEWPSDAFTDIYNRAYEAVFSAIEDAHRVSMSRARREALEEAAKCVKDYGDGLAHLKGQPEYDTLVMALGIAAEHIRALAGPEEGGDD